ncbi:FAD-dependent monooxygenase [Streptomyces sp. DHE17-7]|uniref:FAD-dependent monooxygenase n=1 Tax=Streptomyces sp. DHE17-7 TaxID=2759949 RepID=UPI002FCE11C9
MAGDAAHIHFPAAGQGLNTGLQDAMNLGWKLAAAVQGWARPGLLDSYDAERRPVGRRVTENTEVQTLLMELTLVPRYERPAAALRGLMDELLGQDEVNRTLAGRVSALDTAYPPTDADADPLVGRRMPDITLTVAGFAPPRFLVRPSCTPGSSTFAWPPTPTRPASTRRWRRLTTAVVTDHEDRPELRGTTEILIRPDGHIAWTTRTTDRPPPPWRSPEPPSLAMVPPDTTSRRVPLNPTETMETSADRRAWDCQEQRRVSRERRAPSRSSGGLVPVS